MGWEAESKKGAHFLYLCPFCGKPNYFMPEGRQYPGACPGEDVQALPGEVEALYNEVRNCIASSCHTAGVLACRKLLMHITVAQGADEGKRFIDYVDYLAERGYVPPNGRGWVDHIRSKGNEATHEIKIMSPEDSKELLSFAEMLLKFIYEFPTRIPQPTKPAPGQ